MRDQVFISYSHQDTAWLKRLQVYLAPFERKGQIRRWDDTLIVPGERWASEINEALGRAKVAVLLVSAQFLASDFIARVELPRLLSSAENQGVTILPLVLDWCNFDRVPELAQFQSINSPALPLEALSDIDAKAMLAKLAAAIADAMQAGGGALPGAEAGEGGRLVGMPARNPLFTGRRDLLIDLEKALAQGMRVALCGLAGIGKTEAAIEFAHRQRNRYAWVLWSRAEGVQPLIRGYCAIAAAFGLPEAKGSDQMVTAQAARRALGGREDWLLILDSADDLTLLREWLPEGGHGKVILTTRSPVLSGLAQGIELEPLDDVSAAHFLLLRSRLLPLDAPVEKVLMEPATIIARLLGGLPLALAQAGCYIEETGCSLGDYIELWGKHRGELLAERGDGGLREGESLIDVWGISIGELLNVNPAAVDLLRLLAFFHCECLPDTPLQLGAAFAGPVLGPTLADGLARNDAYRDALRFGFIRKDVKSGKRGMHRLVQTVLRDTLSEQERCRWCMRALEVLNAAMPEPRFVEWAPCDRLTTHALAVLEHAHALAIETGAGARLACETAAYLSQRGRHGEALILSERALAMRRTQADVAPRDLARAYAVCGQIAVGCGRLEQARSLFEIAADTLRPSGASVELARVVDALATVDTSQGNLQAAEQKLGDAAAMIALAGSAESVEAAQIANDLGAVLFKKGDYWEALCAFERAALLRQTLLPGNHPSVAQSLNNLAAVCARLGQTDDARSRYTQALSLREAVFGASHPDVAETLLNIALLDLGCDRLEEARASAERAVAILESCFGKEHAAVAKAGACLGDVALKQRQFGEAGKLYRLAYDVRCRVLGPRHAETARALIGLADVALALGQRVQAGVHLGDAVDILGERLGPTHPDVLTARSELARIHATLGTPVSSEGR